MSARISRLLVCVALLTAISGCANRSEVRQLAAPMTRPPTDVPPPQATGAIFRPELQQRTLFDDRRARRVGDSLTIVLQERVISNKQAATSLERSESSDISVGRVSGLPLKTLQGIGFNHDTSMNADNSGSSSRSGAFTGTIAVTVAEVLPNGNLLVSGDKQIQINTGVENLRFSGIVNPVDVRPNNTVLSTAVANARLEYREEGAIGDNMVLGGLMRMFIKAVTFF